MLRRTLLISSIGAAVANRQWAWAAEQSSTVRVSVSPLLTMSPFYTGFEEGVFRDAGLEVELSRDLPGVQSIPLLAGGKLDVGFVPLSPGLANAVLRGARLRIVAGREMAVSTCSGHRLYARPGTFPDGFHDVRQLRHKKVAISSATPFGMFCMDKLLAPAGMTRADLEIRPINSNDRLPALLSGAVDAMLAISTEPAPMVQSLKLIPGPGLSDVLPNFQFSHIVFGSHLLDGDVRTGATFLRAYFRGAHDFLAGRTPAFLDHFAEVNNLDPAQIHAVCRDSFEHEGRLHLGDMKMYLDWCTKNGYLSSTVNPQDLVDTRFLEALQRTS